MKPPSPEMLTTKLLQPARPVYLVPRQRLYEHLHTGCHAALTLICAPAGFGKTTLVAAWLRTLYASAANSDNPAPQAAWLSLDEGDNDVTQVLQLLIAALHSVMPGTGADARALLYADTPVAPETVLRVLLNDLAQSCTAGSELLLILDDYHLVREPAIHQVMRFLIDHLPHHIRMVLLTREEPPLPLDRWRVQGRLHEIDREQLRFTELEATHFFATGIPGRLDPPAIRAFVERTEGWIAGLHLAALTLQHASDVPRVLAAFNGTHRYVADYLIAEVVERQPHEVQTFLLRTSILERLSASLCAAVLNDTNDAVDVAGDATSNAQEVLAQIERSNLFLLPLDARRDWYRYHHLFGELLRHHLEITQPLILPALHRRASRWYAHAAMTAVTLEDQLYLQRQAVQHALAANDQERAAALVEHISFQLVMQRAWHDMMRLIKLLPDAVIRRSPRLSVWYAWDLTGSGQVDRGESYLRDAERMLLPPAPTHPRTKIAWLDDDVHVLRSRIAHLRGDADAAIALAQHVVSTIPPIPVLRRCLALGALGTAQFCSGRITAAGDTFATARQHALDHADHLTAVNATGMLIETYLIRGALERAATLGYQTWHMAELIVQHTAQDAPGADYVAVCLGAVAFQRNDLPLAMDLVEQGLALGRRHGNIATILRGQTLLAEIAQARGEHGRAQETIQQVMSEVGRLQATLSLRALCTVTYTRLCLTNGNPSAAAQWLARWGFHRNVRRPFPLDLPLDQEVFYLAFARFLLECGDTEVAVEVLTHLATATEQGGRYGHLIPILILQARALSRTGALTAAVEALERAVVLAEPEGYERVFVDEDSEVDQLLMAVLRRHPPGSHCARYVQHLLDARPGFQQLAFPACLPEPLTPRERDIVRLLAEGQSNRMIAAVLYITPETVKHHLKHVYGKLEVHNRTAAVGRARALGLLE